MNNIEIEVKILLQSEENAQKFVEALKSNGELLETGRNSQLNHYFNNGDFDQLKENLGSHLDAEEKAKFDHIIETGKSFSVRTRKADDRVIFVIKASVDETNSINGTGRMEFESDMEMNIDELDQILLDSGFSYGSKWSRDRVEYDYKDYTVCLDKNSGYGYLAELEIVAPDEEHLDATKKKIRDEIDLIGFEELSQDRVNRMYQYYCKNWPDYYGASEFKYFNVD